MSVFGPIFVAVSLEEAICDLLKDWDSIYLKEIRMQLGEPDEVVYPPFRSISTRSAWTAFPEEQLPFAVVVSTGMAEEPTMSGDGVIGGWWGVGVAIAVSANSEVNANRLAKIYTAAVRGIIIQHPQIDGTAGGVDLIDEQYEPILLEGATERSIHSGRLIFRIYKDEVVNRYGPIGPPDEEEQPGSDWPTAEDVIVTTRILHPSKEVDES